MHVTKIDIERRPDQEEYEQTVRVWFDNGGSIRYVEDIHGRIFEQAFTPDDPESVWDDAELGHTDSESLQEFALEAISVSLDQLQDEYSEYRLLEAVTGNDRPTPTDVEYEH